MTSLERPRMTEESYLTQTQMAQISFLRQVAEGEEFRHPDVSGEGRLEHPIWPQYLQWMDIWRVLIS